MSFMYMTLYVHVVVVKTILCKTFIIQYFSILHEFNIIKISHSPTPNNLRK